jgi:hypothetical protein
MRLRCFRYVGLIAVSGMLLSACGNSISAQSSLGKYLTSPNVLACTNMNVVFLGQASSSAVNRQDGENAIDFGKESHDSALRRAAIQLRADADARNQTAVNKDIVNFVVACHKLHLGPTDNSGG